MNKLIIDEFHPWDDSVLDGFETAMRDIAKRHGISYRDWAIKNNALKEIYITDFAERLYVAIIVKAGPVDELREAVELAYKRKRLRPYEYDLLTLELKGEEHRYVVKHTSRRK